jgi:hypothetical protein
MMRRSQSFGKRGPGLRLEGALLILALVAAACAPVETSDVLNRRAGESDAGGSAPLSAVDDETTEGSGGKSSELPASPVALIIPSGTQVDAQGAVEVAITPQGDRFADTGRLVFEVAMNTHSVDLSMDLAQLATLETDTGLVLPAAAWSGGAGHHVTGYLEFDLPQGDGFDQLARAGRWLLTLRGVDAEARHFEWSREPTL